MKIIIIMYVLNLKQLLNRKLNLKFLGGEIVNLTAKMGFCRIKKRCINNKLFKPLNEALQFMAAKIHNDKIKGKTTPYYMEF